MENNVVSLDLAKRLKAAGFPQTVEFTWYCDEERDDTPVLNWTDLSRVMGGAGFTDAKYAAPTAQQIADVLPTRNSKGWLAMRKTESGYSTYYEQDEDYYDECKASTLANALGEQFLLQEVK